MGGLAAVRFVLSPSLQQKKDIKYIPLHVYYSLHSTTDLYKESRLTFMYLVNI